jgi:hypothetical protein
VVADAVKVEPVPESKFPSNREQNRYFLSPRLHFQLAALIIGDFIDHYISTVLHEPFGTYNRIATLVLPAIMIDFIELRTI